MHYLSRKYQSHVIEAFYFTARSLYNELNIENKYFRKRFTRFIPLNFNLKLSRLLMPSFIFRFAFI